jgi:hypothetical protein
MPATFKTKEQLPAGITPAQVQELIRLRLKAGAIRSTQQGDLLITEWNVLGEQD